ncbi:MAG: FecR domain-containing protein [Myxococcales bacterium]|nr:FecR domain-containing protein [Myxococcales bacterium]
MSCSRLWEVTAAHDGRLDAGDSARHERHLAQCAECRAARDELGRVRTALRALPEPAVDEVAVRRARGRLLAAAHGASERSRYSLRVLVPVLLAVAALLVFVGVRRRSVVVPPRVAVVASARVEAGAEARWSRKTEGDVERVDLREGSLAIEVVHATAHRRLLVTLPDGVLEDVGTRFVVTVQAGHTTYVAVQEGEVILRLVGAPPVSLKAGSEWRPAPTVTVTSAAPAVSSAAAPPATVPTIAAVNKPPAPSASVESDPASAELKAALATLRAGDAAGAAQRFAAFVVAHPTHPKAEDAAYLRIVAAQRASDTAGARAAAIDYLARFPKGFRRPEAEAVRDAP